jgi:hypothetical protein
VIDEVELHLDAGHRLVTGERVLAEHHGEGVEAALHFRPVMLAIPSTERGPVDVLAHACADLHAPGPSPIRFTRSGGCPP